MNLFGPCSVTCAAMCVWYDHFAGVQDQVYMNFHFLQEKLTVLPAIGNVL